METCLSGSREASASKTRPGSICGLYPIHSQGYIGGWAIGKHRVNNGPAVMLKWVMSRCVGTNPSGGFGTGIHPVRSTLAAVGSLHTATYATGSMTRLGVRLKTDDEKLNHERGVRPLAVNTGGDGAKPR